MSFWPKNNSTRLVPLKHVCNIDPAFLPETTDPERQFNYVDIGNVTLEKGILGSESHTFGTAPSRARKIVRAGDTIISTVRTYLRAIAFIGVQASDYVVSTGFAVLRPSQDVDPRFLHRVVQSEPFIAGVMAESTGVSYPAITSSRLGKLLVPLPDIVTQRRIADFLDEQTSYLDNLIDRNRQLLGMLDEKETSTITAVTAGELCPGRVRKTLGSVRGPRVVPKWLPLRRFVIDVLNGTTAAQTESGPGTVPVSRIETISGGIINYDRVGHVRYEPSLIPYRLQTGDILFSHINSMPMIGNSAIYNGEGELFGGMNLLRLRPSPSIYPPYLHWCLRSASVRGQIRMLAKPAINQASISIANLKRVLVPHVEEPIQRAIAAFLESEIGKYDIIRARIADLIERLLELRSALITAAVTGQINVETWQQRGETERRIDEAEAEAVRA